jgi:hypothetical protein
VVSPPSPAPPAAAAGPPAPGRGAGGDGAAGRLVAAALAGCGFVAGVFPIFESDLFWHLAAGRWILAHGAIPRIDPFRFGAPPGGLAWVDHEWLFQVVVRAVEAAAGLDGLIVLRALALAGFALALFAVGRRAGLDAGLAGLVALGATLGVRPRFLVRPEIVTLFAIVVLLLLLDRRRGGPAGWRWWSWRAPAAPAALVAVWVNVHGEALLAPGLALLALLGGALGAPAGERAGRARAAVAVSAALAAVLLANPYGWRLVAVPLGIAGALRDLPAANPEWLSAFAAPQPYLFGGMAMVAALAVLARRRTGVWPAPGWGLPALALAALALTAVRHQALFYAAAAPWAAHCLAALPEAAEPPPRTRRRLAWAAALAALAAALWCAFPPAGGPLRPRHGGLAWGFGTAPGRFPERAAEVLAAHPEVGPLYNDFAHGGYLVWRLHPPRRVFLDGRMELEPGLLREIAAARADAGSWSALLARRGAVGALVRYDPRPVPVFEPDGRGGLRPAGESTANALLFPPEHWRLVDWDDETMLFLRPGTAGWEGEPYRAVQPEDLAATLRRAAADPAFAAAARAEVERKLAGQPDCRRATWLRDRLAGLRGAPAAEAGPR